MTPGWYILVRIGGAGEHHRIGSFGSEKEATDYRALWWPRREWKYHPLQYVAPPTF